VFRTVRTDPPTVDDFLPDSECGQWPPNAPAEMAKLRGGITVFQSLFHARRHAAAILRHGKFLAALEIPDSASVRIDTWVAPGGHVVWASPEALLGWVTWKTILR
jgi:hypothetical protein